MRGEQNNARDLFITAILLLILLTPCWNRTAGAVSVTDYSRPSLGVTRRASSATRSAALQQAYQRVLTVLREPPATGLAIVSLQLPPAALRSGLQPGDIIVRVGSTAALSPGALRRAIRRNTHSVLALTVARGQRLKHLTLPLSPASPGASLGATGSLGHAVALGQTAGLHLATLAVIAGAPAPLNPPATPRGRYTLHWRQVPTLQPQPGQVLGHDMWLLVLDRHFACGAWHVQIASRGGRWMVRWNIQGIRGGPLAPNAWRLTLGRRAGLLVLRRGRRWSLSPPARAIRPAVQSVKSPQFTRCRGATRCGELTAPRTPSPLLDAAAARPGPWRRTSVWCRGPVLIGRTDRDGQHFLWRRETVPGALPLPGLMVLAAALPHRRGIVLPVAELSGEPLATQLGCVLQTLGRMPTTVGGVRVKAWAVQELLFDVPQATFWFADQGALLKLQWGRRFTALMVASPAVIRRVFAHTPLVSAPAR